MTKPKHLKTHDKQGRPQDPSGTAFSRRTVKCPVPGCDKTGRSDNLRTHFLNSKFAKRIADLSGAEKQHTSYANQKKYSQFNVPIFKSILIHF